MARARALYINILYAQTKHFFISSAQTHVQTHISRVAHRPSVHHPRAHHPRAHHSSAHHPSAHEPHIFRTDSRADSHRLTSRVWHTSRAHTTPERTPHPASTCHSARRPTRAAATRSERPPSRCRRCSKRGRAVPCTRQGHRQVAASRESCRPCPGSAGKASRKAACRHKSAAQHPKMPRRVLRPRPRVSPSKETASAGTSPSTPPIKWYDTQHDLLHASTLTADWAEWRGVLVVRGADLRRK